jgi:peptidoglycan/xylan/chitin deacetylase (PgdA/CDA1 family)
MPNQQAVLTYHSLDRSGSVISIKPETFRDQIRWLVQSGIAVVPLSELLQLNRSGAKSPAVALTFDDGFENFLTEAFPLLQEHHLPATVFLVTGYCGRTNDWPSQPPEFGGKRLLGWLQIEQLQREGIEFGAHTVNHADLTALSLGEASAEILDSKQQIEDRIGAAVISFAYPFGAESPALREVVAEHFTVGCSTRLGYLDAARPAAGVDPAASVERIDVYYLRNSAWFQRLFSPAGSAYLSLRGLGRTWGGKFRVRS